MAFTGIYGTLPWANIVWLNTTAVGEPSPANLNSLAQFIGSAWGSNLVTHMHTSVSITQCEVSWYRGSGDLLKGFASLALSGAATGQQFPAQVAASIGWLMNASYKGGHPRNYLPGVSATMVTTNNTLSPTFVSSLTAGGNTFRTNVNSYTNPSFSSVQLGCMSFIRNKAWRTPPVFIPFIGAHTDARVDTQRRRLGRDIS